MVSQKVTVMNASGLHARPANAFVKEAVRHAGCNILIKKDGKTYMGKSIVSVLSACVKCGTEIELVAGTGAAGYGERRELRPWGIIAILYE